ncbi:MAG: DinB family protein [Chloroflexota bacterium]
MSDLPITAIFRHNLWANLRLSDACVDLDDAVLDRTTIGTYGTIRAIFWHLAGAEAWYLQCFTHAPFSWDDYEGEAMKQPLSIMRASLEASGQAFVELAATIPAGMEVEELRENNLRMMRPATHFLTQAINHATEHRQEIKTILTQAGIVPPELDSWTFFFGE